MSTSPSENAWNRFLRPHFTWRRLLLFAVVVLAGLGWAYPVGVSNSAPGSQLAESSRLVVVGTDQGVGQGATLHGTLVAGRLKPGLHGARVLSDRDCAPDAAGISHCLNELDLGESVITIRHHHRMNEVPCLRPGETVRVVDEATYTEQKGS